MWPRLGRQARPGGWEQVLGLLQSAPDFGARDEGRGPAEEGIPAAPPPPPCGFWEIPGGGVVLLIPENPPWQLSAQDWKGTQRGWPTPPRLDRSPGLHTSPWAESPAHSPPGTFWSVSSPPDGEAGGLRSSPSPLTSFVTWGQLGQSVFSSLKTLISYLDVIQSTDKRVILSLV